MWLFSAFSIPKEYGPLPAITKGSEVLSYDALASAINAQAKTLLQKGVFAGARVALIAEPSIPTIIKIFALLQIKASPLLLSTRLPDSLIPLRLKEGRASFFLKEESITPLEKYLPLSSYILLFTSGSTGKPKLACLTFENFLLGAKGALPFLELEKKAWLLSVPLFHVSGLSILFRALLAGATITFNKEDATHASLVPTQLLRMIRKELILPKASFLLLGGAPIGEELLKQTTLPIRKTYGLTEMASQVTMTTKGKQSGLGKVLPGRELTLSKEGEILVKGDTLFAGYDEEKGPLLPLQEEWFATKDLATRSSDGTLHYKGRKDNLFISGGENIYPEEIEKALMTLPGVLLASVIPKEDPEFGKRPIAFIHMDEELPSQKHFEELLSDTLPRFAIPIKHLPYSKEMISNSKLKI